MPWRNVSKKSNTPRLEGMIIKKEDFDVFYSITTIHSNANIFKKHKKHLLYTFFIKIDN